MIAPHAERLGVETWRQLTFLADSLSGETLFCEVIWNSLDDTVFVCVEIWTEICCGILCAFFSIALAIAQTLPCSLELHLDLMQGAACLGATEEGLLQPRLGH